MTTALWCLMIVAVFPFVLAGIGGYLRVQQLGNLDNNHPRIQAFELRGPAARAYAAQHNAWEATTIFGTAVVISHLAGADPAATAMPAMIFVAVRILHAVTYIADIPAARTLVFVVGLGCIVWLFRLAAVA